MVIAYTHGVMGCQINTLSYFSFLPVLHDWCSKGCGMCYPVCGMMHIKEPLLLIGKSSLCGDMSGFPLSSVILYHMFDVYNHIKNVLSTSLNKTFPSFLSFPAGVFCGFPQYSVDWFQVVILSSLCLLFKLNRCSSHKRVHTGEYRGSNVTRKAIWSNGLVCSCSTCQTYCLIGLK